MYLYFFLFTSHIYFPSTITVDSVNHTYTGTLSSSTYSGYKLAANSNKVVSAGNHTLTGYTGNNITLAISGNTVSVNNTKTSTNRTTELQNFIKNNWSQKFWKDVNVNYAYARELGYGKNMPASSDRNTYRITIRLTRLTSQISVNDNDWYYEYITYTDASGYSETDYTISDSYVSNRVWWPSRTIFQGVELNILNKIVVFRSGKNLIWSRATMYTKHGGPGFVPSGTPNMGEEYNYAAAVCWT